MSKVKDPARRAQAPKSTGRLPHQPDDQSRRFVNAMAQVGIKQEDIGKVVGISHATLEKHYRQELDTALTKALSLVGQSVLMQALGGPPSADGKINWKQAVPSMAIWFEKTRGGLKEIIGHEHTGKDGAPVAQITEMRVVFVDAGHHRTECLPLPLPR
jgi:hypothetical protein